MKKFECVAIAFLLLVLLSRQDAIAQERLTIDGPEVVDACDLVRLDVELEPNESALWIVEPDSLDYEIVGNRLIFSLGCLPEASVLVIAASVHDGSVRFRQVKHRVRVGNGPNPPTDEPPPPINEPTRDWSEITNWIREQAAPGSDPTTAALYAERLKLAAAQMQGESLERARTLIGEVRRTVFVERTDFSTNWNPFLTELDSKIKVAPPSDTQQYHDLVIAIAAGLAAEDAQPNNTHSKGLKQ